MNEEGKSADILCTAALVSVAELTVLAWPSSLPTTAPVYLHILLLNLDTPHCTTINHFFIRIQDSAKLSINSENQEKHLFKSLSRGFTHIVLLF